MRHLAMSGGGIPAGHGQSSTPATGAFSSRNVPIQPKARSAGIGCWGRHWLRRVVFVAGHPPTGPLVLNTLVAGAGRAFLPFVQPSFGVVPRPPPPVTVRPKKSRIKAVGILVALFAGGLLGFALAKAGLTLLLPVPGPKVLKLAGVAALPLIWLAVVGFHELGHLVGGWLVGGRFLLWVAGPFMVRRTPGGIRVSWNRSVNVAGGMGACLPLEPGRMTPRRAAVMILGGPLASLVLAVGMLWLAVGLAAGAGPASAVRALAQHGAIFTAGVSVLIFLVTAIPGTAGGFKTDGKRVLDLMRGGPRSRQESALLVLTTAGLAGIRPADYDRGLMAQAQALGDGSLFDLYGHLMAYYHAADRGEWAEAQRHLDVAMGGEDQLVPFIRDTVRCEYAWLLAGSAADPVTARAWLESAGKLEFDPATRLRAEAAVLLAEDRRAEAATKARAGLNALEHRSMSPVKSPFAMDALEEILRHATA